PLRPPAQPALPSARRRRPAHSAARRHKAKSLRRKPRTSRSVSSLKPPQAFVVDAILDTVPGSGKHGGIAFRRTAARCHNAYQPALVSWRSSALYYIDSGPTRHNFFEKVIGSELPSKNFSRATKELRVSECLGR